MPKPPPEGARTEAEASSMMSPQDVRQRLGISAPSLARMIRSGQIPAPLLLRPHLPRWERETLENWLAAKRQAATAAGGASASSADAQ
jgi:predicted DNA-binding transcriptional regulator AlpA